MPHPETVELVVEIPDVEETVTSYRVGCGQTVVSVQQQRGREEWFVGTVPTPGYSSSDVLVRNADDEDEPWDASRALREAHRHVRSEERSRLLRIALRDQAGTGG